MVTSTPSVIAMCTTSREVTLIRLKLSVLFKNGMSCPVTASPFDTGAANVMFELRVMLMMEVLDSLSCILFWLTRVGHR